MGSVQDGLSAGELSLRLVDEFAEFGPAYRKWMESRLRGCGVSYARMRLLGALHCGGPRIMSSISEELGVTRRNVTALVDALEDEGLVRRTAHPTDRRATVIELTAHGEETLSEGTWEDHREAAAELFEDLTADERRELLRIIGRLGGRLRSEGLAE